MNLWQKEGGYSMDKQEKKIHDLEFERDNLKLPYERYKKGFNILMEYFDSISDEEKLKVDQMLRDVGL